MSATQDLMARQTKALSEGKGVVEQTRQNFTESLSATTAKSMRLFDTAQHAATSETSEGRSIQDSLSTMSTMERSYSEELQRSGGFTKSVADIMATQATRTGRMDLEAALATGLSAGAPGLSNLSLNGKGSLSSQYMAQQSRNSEDRSNIEQSMRESMSSVERQANSETATSARDTFYRQTASSSNSELRGLSNETQASLAQTRSASEEYSRAEDTYSRYSQEISEARSRGFQYSANLSQEYANWWDTKGRFDPANFDIVRTGYAPGMANMTWQQRQAEMTGFNRFLDGKIEQMRADFGTLPEGPEHRLSGPVGRSVEDMKTFAADSMAQVQGAAPVVRVESSARDEGLRTQVGDRIGESRAEIEDRGYGLRREQAAGGLEASRMREAVGERQTGSLWNAMPFDGDFRTPSEDARHNAPPVPSGPVDTILPRKGIGFTTYGRTGGGANQAGTGRFVDDLQELGRRWSGTGGTPISFGDISSPGGGDMPGHQGHERGREVDVRPFRDDGRNAPVTWRSPQYDRAATREFVQMVRQEHPDATILFNDPELVREGLVQRYDGHDNHLHLRLPGGRRRGR